jgi:uncharacterized membrane protein
MAFCSNCGTETQGKFCAKCGSPVGAGPEPAASAAPPSPQGYPQQGYSQAQGSAPAQGGIQAGGLTDNVASALCYSLGLLTGVLFLVLAPYNQNRLIRFHAFQSIFVHVALIATMIAIMILTGILHLIPFVGVMISFVLYPVVGLGAFVLWMVLIYKAYNNERWVLPIVGPLAEKQA